MRCALLALSFLVGCAVGEPPPMVVESDASCASSSVYVGSARVDSDGSFAVADGVSNLLHSSPGFYTFDVVAPVAEPDANRYIVLVSEIAANRHAVGSMSGATEVIVAVDEGGIPTDGTFYVQVWYLR